MLIVFPGVNPNANPRVELVVRVRVSLRSHLRLKIFHLHNFETLFPGRLRRYSCFAFGFRVPTLFVFSGVDLNPNSRVNLRVRVRFRSQVKEKIFHVHIVRGAESETLPPSGIFADMYHFKASPEGI